MKMKPTTLCSIGLAVALITAGGSVAQAAATFQGLGKLPGGENHIVGSFADGLSANGLVVAGYSGSANGQEAFRWTAATGMVTLVDVPGVHRYSDASGVSADGSVVVGGGRTQVRYEPFRWTATTGMVGLGVLSGGMYNAGATDVSADGSVVVGGSSAPNDNVSAYRWTAADGMVALGQLPGDRYSEGYGVSGDGTVVVGESGPDWGISEAFRWTQAGGMQGLGDLPGGATASGAHGISADGSVVVGWGSTEDGTAPFRWTVAGGMQGLGAFPNNPAHGLATDASADGSVIVGWNGAERSGDLEGVAFIWDEHHGMRDLRQLLINQGADLTGWTLTDANAVSDDGRTVVGWGLNPAGKPEAWIATLALAQPPPPSIELPALKIARSGPSVILSWPATTVNLQLEATADLTLPDSWLPVAQQAVSNDGQITVTLPADTDRKFFRLKSLGGDPPPGMALIPAGSFTMGNSFDASEGFSRELPLHSVYVSAFYMDRYEVTKALWDEVRTWANANGYDLGTVGDGKAANHPVQSVDWYDVVKWCNARSEQEGRVPAYYTSAGQTTVYRTGQVDVQDDWVKWNAGYRLPTEAEWEKAARGGVSGRRFPWSDSDTIQHSRANYNATQHDGTNLYAYDTSPTSWGHPTFATGDGRHTSPVGYFGANGYGLYDMAGNVWEWCWDWHGAYWSASQTDPRGPASGSYRAARGGSCQTDAIVCRTAYRGYASLDNRDHTVGFRSALPAGQ